MDTEKQMMDSVIIESLDHEGQGVAHKEGKTLFIEGALPGERVFYHAYRKKPAFEKASLTSILHSSPSRVTPPCRVYGRCGGCSLQHLEESAQVAMKQRVLEDNLWHIGRVRPETMLPAVHGPGWHYRHRARLSVRRVQGKGVLIGFHEKRSSFIVDTLSCDILAQPVARLLGPLRQAIEELSIVSHLPQIEVAVGEETSILVLRILEPLTSGDEKVLRNFSGQNNIEIWLQPKGPTSAYRFCPDESPLLYYSLPEFNLRLPFFPTEFTQINPDMNRALIHRAMQLLFPRPGEKVLDLFCGMGNFSLPIARTGAKVTGIEGDKALVKRASENASLNGLEDQAKFVAGNLFEIDEQGFSALGHFDRMLIDPPRDGAIAVVKALDIKAPDHIVYVSCNPATLARDASVLVHTKAYQLKAAGVFNMFPHTAHIESVALFERA